MPELLPTDHYLYPTETVYTLDGWEADWSAGEITVVAEAPQIVVDKIRDLAENFDGARCEADNCPLPSGGYIGWYLNEGDGDSPSTTGFRYTALVVVHTTRWLAERVIAICEDCHAALLPAVTVRVPVKAGSAGLGDTKRFMLEILDEEGRVTGVHHPLTFAEACKRADWYVSGEELALAPAARVRGYFYSDREADPLAPIVYVGHSARSVKR